MEEPVNRFIGIKWLFPLVMGTVLYHLCRTRDTKTFTRQNLQGRQTAICLIKKIKREKTSSLSSMFEDSIL